MNKVSIGVDLGGTNLRIAAVDEQGTLLEKVTLGTKVSLGRDQVIDDMCDGIRRMSEKFQDSTLLGIGIGVPGFIDIQTGLLRESPNLPGWADYPVRAEIERRLKTIVILENDANVAALGEKWLGAGKDFPDMLMVTLGTGVGGGLVIDGAIWHGANGMAGEIGHTTVEPDGHPCGCGNRGCLEQYASATAIVRMARETVAINGGSALARSANSDSEFSAKSIYNLAIQGDEDALHIYRRVGPLSRSSDCGADQFTELSDLCNWWRGFERVGGFCADDFRGIAGALHRVCRKRATRSFGPQARCVCACDARARTQDDYHSLVAG